MALATLTFPSPYPTALVIASLTRIDTGGAVTGVLSSLGSGVWTLSITEPAPGLTYAYTLNGTWADGGTAPIQGTVPGTTSNVTGFWTSQAAIERFIGAYLADQLSNVNQTTAGPDAVGFSIGIAQAANFTNYELFLFGYPSGATSPAFPTTSMAYGQLCDANTVLASYWIYVKRGIFDDKDKAGGKFQKLKEEAEATIRRIVRNRIPDVARAGWSHTPAVIVEGHQPALAASTIGQVP